MKHHMEQMEWIVLWLWIAQMANQDKANRRVQNAKLEMKFWMENAQFAMEQRTAAKEQDVISSQIALQEMKDRAFHRAHIVKLDMNWKKEDAQFAQGTRGMTMG